MLRKLTKRITNNFGLKILAAVFAIILWMVVVNIEDPEKTKGFTIPVTIENNEYLSDMGKTYEILNNTDKISFTVTGKRSIIEELSESDFTAVANLENINDDMPYEIGIIRNYIIKNNGYSGTISNLLQLTKLTIAANRASRLLNTHKDLLASEGITFSIDPSRSNGRIYTFQVEQKDDKDDTLCI